MVTGGEGVRTTMQTVIHFLLGSFVCEDMNSWMKLVTYLSSVSQVFVQFLGKTEKYYGVVK